jgi:hypothetical protein
MWLRRGPFLKEIRIGPD